MISPEAWKLELDFHSQKPIQLEPVPEHLSTDRGLLLFRQLDEQLGLTEAFAGQVNDLRMDPEPSILEMVRSRVYGIIAGYEDQNDHDALRSDAVFKLLAGRLSEEDDLASQPTLSRFENAVTPRDLLNLEAWFLQRFVDSFPAGTREITLDIDVFDDPTHGQQPLTFFHGFYDPYQYLIRAITCAENDALAMPVLLYGTAHAALGADADLRRVVAALRKRFPDVRIHVRADSGFAVPRMYEACEELQVNDTIEIGMNAVLQRRSETLLAEALAPYEQTHQPQRLFTQFDYQAESWPQSRQVVVKCEADPLGEGHVSTWRMMVIKVAARIHVQVRRVRVFLSGSWPFLPYFRQTGEALLTGS